MLTPSLNVSNRFILLFFFFIISSTLLAQKNQAIWESLLENNRSEALKLVEGLDIESDLESFLLRSLVRSENGLMKAESDFIDRLSKFEDHEHYLFANWNMAYVFSDYIGTGFDSYNLNAVQKVDVDRIKNTTIKSGILYLKAIAKRYQKDWKGYNEYYNSINALRDWEYCGVFENLNNSGLESIYGPETEVSSDVLFETRGNGDVSWYKYDNGGEAYQFLSNHSEYGSGVHYAQTFIQSETDQRVHLKIGKGDLVQVFLNDVLVVENTDPSRTELDAFTYAVNFQKGNNRLMIKTASANSEGYFIIRLENEQGEALTNYKVSLNQKEYKKGNLASVNPELVPHAVEQFFLKKLADKTADKYLTKFNLYLTYFRNAHFDEAKAIINEMLVEYPQSSFLKSCLLECYSLEGDTTTFNEIKDNLKRTDPDYYYSLLTQFQNTDELFKMDIGVYEETLSKVREAIDYDYIKTGVDLLIELRRNNLEGTRNILDRLITDGSLPSSVKPTFSEFYSKVFNDDLKSVEVLQGFNTENYNYPVIQYLSYYYKKLNRIDDAINIYDESLEQFGYDNNTLYEVILLMHDHDRYEESIPLIDKAILNYPYTYTFVKLKGDAYIQLNKKKEGIKLYKKALERSVTNNQLRTTLFDLTKESNPLNDFHESDYYPYIKTERNIIKENNYGINTLLDQTDVWAYENGGGRYYGIQIYEITSQNGIESFKEHNLGLSGDYIIYKSEIVKPDGTTVPADKSGSSFVFNGLSIGDVIYISYESSFSGSGRFYKDFIDSTVFQSYHPILNKTYRLITNQENVGFKVTNGSVPYKKIKKGSLFVHEWSVSALESLPLYEDYMPPFTDVASTLHISTIESWNAISEWYSDLVRVNIETDEITEMVLKKIFPAGHSSLSETERAKRIYNYITDSFNYSSVSFRQSGFVPQKPSKTINTKLGDCKDFSTLFVTLAQEVGLKANLVLVLTADYGDQSLVMPSTDFNHCIAEVSLEGNPQLLELTSKYLPFGTLPMSLRHATGLKIPIQNGAGNHDLFRIDEEKRIPSLFSSNYEMFVGMDSSKIELTTNIAGDLSTYYFDTFSNKKDKSLEDAMIADLKNRTNMSVVYKSHDNVSIDKESDEVSFDIKLVMDEKVTKIGSLYTIRVPYFSNPYNKSIISLDKRFYPINYIQYENSDSYKDQMIVNLEDAYEFIELPENKSYRFKNHQFEVTYEKLKANQLRIDIRSTTSMENISDEDYPEFREYVRNVLETQKQVFVFK